MPVKRDIRRTTKRLKEAQQVLQNGLDYIEVCGFNISTELEDGSVITDEYLKAIRNGEITDIGAGGACYIGSARIGAGVNPQDFYRLGTDGGDGPELSIALEYLDAAVPEEYRERAEECDERSSDSPLEDEDYLDGRGPGGVAEAYGFIREEEFGEETRPDPGSPHSAYHARREAMKDKEAEVAKELYKTALRQIYKDIERKEK